MLALTCVMMLTSVMSALVCCVGKTYNASTPHQLFAVCEIILVLLFDCDTYFKQVQIDYDFAHLLLFIYGVVMSFV